MSEIVRFLLAQLDGEPPWGPVTATRRELHRCAVRAHDTGAWPYERQCAVCLDEGQNFDADYPCDFLRLYAWLFHDQPDYRGEWLP